LLYNAPMRNEQARQLGFELTAYLERLKVLVKEAQALEISVVNLNSAIDILTE
jgi:hypothetical protein